MATVTLFVWMLSFGSSQSSSLYVDHALRPTRLTATATASGRTPEGGQLATLVREFAFPVWVRRDGAQSPGALAMEPKNGYRS